MKAKQKFSIKAPNDLSICDYLKVAEIIEDKQIDSWKKDLMYLAICTGISYEELMKKTPSEINAFSTEIKKSEGFFSKLRLSRPKKLKINGNDYVINYNLEKFNMSQYVDFQTYIREDNTIKNLHNILSVVIIPEGKDYNENYDIEEVKTDIFNHLGMGVANDICFFLKKQSQILIECKLMYYIMEMRLLKWTTKDKERKKQLEKIVQEMKNFKKQILDCF